MNRFFREEEGQGLVEYALIIGLIAIVAIAALSAAGGSVSGLFNNINSKLGEANSGQGLQQANPWLTCNKRGRLCLPFLLYITKKKDKERIIMRRKNKKSGQGLVEYALIIGLIAIVAIAALSQVSTTLKNFYFDTIPNALNQVPGSH